MILKENLLENNSEIKKGKNKMIFIVAVIIIIYLIEIAWTWQSLGWIEKNKKILIIVARKHRGGDYNHGNLSNRKRWRSK